MPTYNSESIDRALMHARQAGLIGGWLVTAGDHRVVTLASGDLFDLQTNREAYVFIRGLITASDAVRLELAAAH